MRIAETTTLYVALVAVAIPLVVSCTGCSSSDGAVTCTLTGVVVHDADRSPLDGVRVTDNVVETNTDADGRFSLTVTHKDTATVYVLADGFEVVQRQVAVFAGTEDLGTVTVKPVILPRHGKVTGVVARAGEPVSGAQVTVGGIRAVSRTDGTYALYNVPAGQQTVVASYGDLSGSVSVQVLAERTVTADIAVTTGPPVPL